MRICLFGTFDRNRPRNKILEDGLRQEHEVFYCHYPVWQGVEDKSQISKTRVVFEILPKMLIAYLVISVKFLFAPRSDLVLVGYLGHFDIFLARSLAALKGGKVVLNLHVSLYDTVVEDRKYLGPRHPLAKLLARIDQFACSLAHAVIVDTEAYKRYISETFRVPASKLIALPVGADPKVFQVLPRSSGSPEGRWKVLFYGQFIPLQGAEFIVKAAEELASHGDIEFTLIGSGQEKAALFQLAQSRSLTNVRWIDWVEYDRLPQEIHTANLCLGIFGESAKCGRVIPNKVFQAIACGRPVLTKRTPAILEIFEDRKNIFLCEDPTQLAKAILVVKENAPLASEVSRQALEVFHEILTPEKIASMFRSGVERAFAT